MSRLIYHHSECCPINQNCSYVHSIVRERSQRLLPCFVVTRIQEHDERYRIKCFLTGDGPSKANRRDVESGTSASQAHPKSPTDHHQTPESIAIELHIIPLLCEPHGISIGAQNLLPPSTLVGSQPPLHICIGVLCSSKPNFKQSHLKPRTHFAQLHFLLSSSYTKMMSK